MDEPILRFVAALREAGVRISPPEAADALVAAGAVELDDRVSFRAALRGTLVNDRLRLERVDSRLGFSAIYYGRVARDATSIAGTWEATTFGNGVAGAGVWKALREEDREEGGP